MSRASKGKLTKLACYCCVGEGNDWQTRVDQCQSSRCEHFADRPRVLVYVAPDAPRAALEPRKPVLSATDQWLDRNPLTDAPVPALLPGETAPRVSAAWLDKHAGNRTPGGPSPAPPSRPAKRIAYVWADGSCLVNPGGPMGIGVVVEIDGDQHLHGEGLGPGTNNIAEITALKRGIELAIRYSPEEIVIYSDSQYALGMVFKNWKAQKNVELIAATKRTLDECPAAISYAWVKGHAGNAGNELADQLAEAAAREPCAPGLSWGQKARKQKRPTRAKKLAREAHHLTRDFRLAFAGG